VGVAHKHELNLDAPDNTPTNEGPEVPDEGVVLVLRYAVVHLAGQMLDVRLCPLGDVFFEQAAQSEVNSGTDEVAPCVSGEKRWR